MIFKSKKKNNFFNKLIFGELDFNKVYSYIKILINNSKYKGLVIIHNYEYNLFFEFNSKKIAIFNKIKEF